MCHRPHTFKHPHFANIFCIILIWCAMENEKNHPVCHFLCGIGLTRHHSYYLNDLNRTLRCLMLNIKH
eukprot:UN06288